MTTTDERAAITMAKLWLGYGQRGLDQALAILTRAADQMLGRVDCDNCGNPIYGEPVTDPETTAWQGMGLPRFCSLVCREASDERRIDAAGNGRS